MPKIELTSREIEIILKCMDITKGEYTYPDDTPNKWEEHDTLRDKLTEV